MSQVTIRRPFGELDLGEQLGTNDKRTKGKGLIKILGKTKPMDP
jgi:hypothetical protein